MPHAAILQHEALIRFGFFLGILLILNLWEWLAPKRIYQESKRIRWSTNLLMVGLDALAIRLLFPAATVGVAAYAMNQQWGLLYAITLPYWFKVILCLIILDFTIYLQHVLFHAIPLFWRVHRVHHTDLDFDVTTGVRFHPVEIILSLFIKLGIIILLGVPPLAAMLFEILLNATSLFNHSNISMPKWLDSIIRAIIVTPDMHRVHHSVLENETNSNFGFNFSWWDRLLGTYRRQPKAGHIDMTIGLSNIRDKRYCIHLWGLLILPFIKGVTGYAINRRKNNDQ